MAVALPGSVVIATAKVPLTIAASSATARVGDVVTVTTRLEVPDGNGVPCPGMRIDAIAPGITIHRALKTLEGGQSSVAITRRAFRLASIRQRGPQAWTARIRFPTAGRWRFIVPNWCAQGYVIPEGVATVTVDVTPI